MIRHVIQFEELGREDIGLVGGQSASLGELLSAPIKILPMALVRFDQLADSEAPAEIEQLTRGFKDKGDYFVDKLPLGLGRVAALAWPNPAIVRMSDFKTNEYAKLLRGSEFEPVEAVKWMIHHVIAEAHQHGAKVGLCGQGPSDHPEFARFPVACGINSISVSPDSFVEVCRHVAQAEPHEEAA